MEVDAKGAGLLFRLIGLDCWWVIADSNFIYHIETRYDIQKTKNGTKILLNYNFGSIDFISLKLQRTFLV